MKRRTLGRVCILGVMSLGYMYQYGVRKTMVVEGKSALRAEEER